MEDFVGVSVADTAEQAWVGERALERVVFRSQSFTESFEIGVEDVNPARINGFECGFVVEEMKRCTALGSSFGKNQRSVGEIEGCEILAASEFGAGITPVKTPRDHEMKAEPVIIVETESDALSDAAKFADNMAFHARNRWSHCTEQKSIRNTDMLKGLADDARFERSEIGSNVGKFGHEAN